MKTNRFLLLAGLALMILGLAVSSSQGLAAQGREKPIDVVLAINSSASMTDNDQQNQRLTGAKAFVDLLNPRLDQVAVISWDDGIDFVEHLTSDFGRIKDRIDDIDSSGGTKLDLGLSASIDELASRGRPEAIRVILFLTDGEDDTYTFSHQEGSQVQGKASHSSRNEFR